MYLTRVDAAYNGIVLFDPIVLKETLGEIVDGEDLFERFMTSDEGDLVLEKGAIVPILAIDDDGYDVVVRMEDEEAYFATRSAGDVVRNGIYALKNSGNLVVAGLIALREWTPGVDWHTVTGVLQGCFSVTVTGYLKREDGGRRVTLAGYEFVLSREEVLPEVTADTGAPMRL